MKIIDKYNSDFYKKIKEHNINLRHQTQAEQNTRSREYCRGCDLYVCKLHLCSAIGAWINIDTRHLHIIVGKEEEDVRRTRELEDDEYSVYYFNNKQDLQNKLRQMVLQKEGEKQREREKEKRKLQIYTKQ